MSTPRACWSALPALFLLACRGAPAERGIAPAETAVSEVGEPSALPMDLAGEHESTLGYLLARHDADGDGQITRGEYRRSETAFGRLDRNDDGVISAGDWQRRSRDEDSSAMERMRRMRATGTLAMYFQRDDPGRVTLDEIEAAAAAYDSDDDGRIGAEEFTCAYEQRRVELPGSMGRFMRRMGNTTPWEALVAGIDEDGDGSLARTELASFFNAAVGEGDGVMTLSQPTRSTSTPSATRTERPQPPPVGAVAPDFTVASPDGGERVTLSDFAGEKPVALIFGSYT